VCQLSFSFYPGGPFWWPEIRLSLVTPKALYSPSNETQPLIPLISLIWNPSGNLNFLSFNLSTPMWNPLCNPCSNFALWSGEIWINWGGGVGVNASGFDLNSETRQRSILLLLIQVELWRLNLLKFHSCLAISSPYRNSGKGCEESRVGIVSKGSWRRFLLGSSRLIPGPVIHKFHMSWRSSPFLISIVIIYFHQFPKPKPKQFEKPYKSHNKEL